MRWLQIINTMTSKVIYWVIDPMMTDVQRQWLIMHNYLFLYCNDYDEIIIYGFDNFVD